MFVEKLDLLDGALVVVDNGGVRTHIPIGASATRRSPWRRARKRSS
jgi:hypothetical protein